MCLSYRNFKIHSFRLSKNMPGIFLVVHVEWEWEAILAATKRDCNLAYMLTIHILSVRTARCLLCHLRLSLSSQEQTSKIK